MPVRAYPDPTSRSQDKPENPNVAAARQAIDAKDFQSALGHLTKAVQEAPNDADAHSRLGYSYRKLGSYDKSKESYLKALKIDSRHRGAREYLGELYLVLNQPSDAERELHAERELQALKKAFHPRSGEKKWGIDTESFPMGASVTRSSPRPA